jgi:uncharacterized protein YllA (UPF0747 family)
MKLLAFADEPGGPAPDPAPRPAIAGLAGEDAPVYARWIAHLCRRNARLDPWREPLASGSAVVVLTGQQPGLLGGPLYTLYKALTAVVAARRLRAAGQPAIAAFWCVGDDTDHDEVAFTSWPRRTEPPARVRDEIAHEGERIGGLPAARMEAACAQLRSDWPGAVETLDAIDRARTGGGDWSGFLAASLDALIAEPILFLDGNDPVTIEVSQSWLRRAAPERAALGEALAARAAAVRDQGEVPRLTGEEATRCLFVLEGTGRRLLPENEIPSSGAKLLPNVVLRPLLQEYLLPVAQVVCGDAEIAYRRLLPPIYERLGGQAAPLLRRFGATLFPPIWGTDPSAPPPGATLSAPDRVLEEWALENLPAGLVDRVARVRKEVGEALEALVPALAEVDRSLPQLLDSARGKIDFQIRRIDEALVSKARQRLQRKGPEIAFLREFLLPRGGRQERSFTLWTPGLFEGGAVYPRLEGAVEAWFDRLGEGHAMLAIEGGIS